MERLFQDLDSCPANTNPIDYFVTPGNAGRGLHCARTNQSPSLAKPDQPGYITYFRGIPLVIHLFIVYYGLPVLLTAILPPLFGISPVKLQRLNPLYAIVITYTLYTAAFMSEIIRGAYQSVDRQQLDAARALGYTKWQTYSFIKLPQALVEALPKLLNYYLLLIRQLSLAFLVSFVYIFAQAQLQSAINYRYIESYCAAALIYWLIGIVLTLLFGRWEGHLKKYQLNR